MKDKVAKPLSLEATTQKREASLIGSKSEEVDSRSEVRIDADLEEELIAAILSGDKYIWRIWR